MQTTQSTAQGFEFGTGNPEGVGEPSEGISNKVARFDHVHASNAQYDLTITTNGTGWSTVRAVGIPYQTANGTWRLKFNIRGSVTSGTSSLVMSVSGVVFKNIVNFEQGVSLSTNSTDYTRAWATYSTGINLFVGTAATIWRVSGDVELDSKPTFM